MASTTSKTLVFDFGTYTGEIDSTTGRRHGTGVLVYHNGNQYDGHWQDGAAHGVGVKSYSNGDVYAGEWLNGKRVGHGLYRFSNGDTYEGEYLDDHSEGYGQLLTHRGERYEGEWMKGRRHGAGKETMANGQVFTGTWVRGRKNGQGELTTPEGKCVIGNWSQDRCIEVLSETLPPEDGSTSRSRDEKLSQPMFDEATVQSLAERGVDGATLAAVERFNLKMTNTVTGVSRGLESLDHHLAQLTSALEALEFADEEMEDDDDEGLHMGGVIPGSQQ